mgnify:CR=1 FL=1
MHEEALGDRIGRQSAPTAQWFALTVKPRFEKTVAGALQAKGLDSFLPLYQVRRRWSDRTKLLELPLFPGYVFSRFLSAERVPVLRTPGVRSIVGFGREPVSVPDAEIASVRAMVTSGLPVTPRPFLREGQDVIVIEGPLRGVAGKLAGAEGEWQVVVNVQLLRRSVAVTLDRGWVAPAGPVAADTGCQQDERN